MKEGRFLLQSSSVAVVVLVLLCTSALCDKEVTHPAIFYKEDYVSADYDPTTENKTSSVIKPNSLLRSERLVFDYTEEKLKPEIKHHNRHHKRIRHYDDILKRSKRQTFNDPHGVFSEPAQQDSQKSSNRQRRQYYQPPYNTYNTWSGSNGYSGYFVTPNFILPPQTYNLPSNYYLPANTNHHNNQNSKIPIRGIYYNPISVPGNFAAVKPNPPSVSIDNRLGDPDYFDERPVWGVRYENTPPAASVSVTTRRPNTLTTRRPTTVSTIPPLLHGRDRPTQNTAPPLVNGRDNNVVATRRPLATITTRRPQVIPTTSRPTSPQEPSKCVWAIVSCCSRDNPTVRYQCFEQMGCMGAFWGLNPCANDIQDVALDAADRYFD